MPRDKRAVLRTAKMVKTSQEGEDVASKHTAVDINDVGAKPISLKNAANDVLCVPRSVATPATWFGTRGSEVQILSPRPIFFRTNDVRALAGPPRCYATIVGESVDCSFSRIATLDKRRQARRLGCSVMPTTHRHLLHDRRTRKLDDSGL